MKQNPINSGLPTDLFTYGNVHGLPNSLKYGLRCGLVDAGKSYKDTDIH